MTDDQAQKPREWVLPLKTLIINDGKGLSAWVRQDREDEIHVIEKSAYDALAKELAAARASITQVREEMYTQMHRADNLQVDLDLAISQCSLLVSRADDKNSERPQMTAQELRDALCEKYRTCDEHLLDNLAIDLIAIVCEQREALEHVRDFCVCERFKTKGFDYSEEHRYRGKPKAGARWLTPKDVAIPALADTDQRLKEMGVL